MNHNQDDYPVILRFLLEIKCREFTQNGYTNINRESLWDYFIKYKWKKNKKLPRIHKMVSDIINTDVVDYMNFVTVTAITKKSDTQSPLHIDQDELNKLL